MIPFHSVHLCALHFMWNFNVLSITTLSVQIKVILSEKKALKISQTVANFWLKHYPVLENGNSNILDESREHTFTDTNRTSPFSKIGPFSIFSFPPIKKLRATESLLRLSPGHRRGHTHCQKRLCRFTVRPRSTQRLKILVEGDEVPYLSYIMNR